FQRELHLLRDVHVPYPLPQRLFGDAVVGRRLVDEVGGDGDRIGTGYDLPSDRASFLPVVRALAIRHRRLTGLESRAIRPARQALGASFAALAASTTFWARCAGTSS